MLSNLQIRSVVVSCARLLLGSVLIACPLWGVARAEAVPGQDQEQQALLSDETATAIKQVTQTLKRAALDENPEIRIAAVSSLPMFVQYDAEIVDVLWAAVDSSEPAIRQAGINAIIASGESSDKTIDALLILSGDEELDPETRERIVERLRGMGAQTVVPRAVAAIQGDHPVAKQQAISVLMAFGTKSQPAVEALLTVGMSANESVELRASALTMAAQITSEVALQEKQDNKYRAEAETQAVTLLEQFDRNGDGSLAFDGSEGITANNFAEFDADNSGTLSKTELTAYCLEQRRRSNSRTTRGGRSRGDAERALERALENQRGRGGFQAVPAGDPGGLPR